jgi:SpoVK/Ycf46/Vps4 family AAA+-type ATPase
VSWDDIAGLEHAKAVVQEVAVWPLLAPALFRGARAVPRGILLFGPPGTGKTLIGRAIAAQCAATFFGISAASLGSKWIGEGEKLVRALFAVATVLAPSVVFVDEIDALLSARKGGEGEHEASRRLKTEFLVQMEGLDGGGEDRPVLLVGATNRPAELDEAARRRLAKQIYIPLPCGAARKQLVRTLLRAGAGGADAAAVTECAHTLSEADLDTLAARTDGYSGSDMKHLVQEAARAPLRELRGANVDLAAVGPADVRPITLDDFRRAAKQVRASVTAADVAFHESWNARHGAQATPADGDASDGEWG